MRTPRFIRSLMIALVLVAVPAAAWARPSVAIGISVGIAPPVLPVYVQPVCPAEGYIWTPGYWAWDPDYGYYWVPGTWVLAPEPGLLWTPGYWGWNDSAYFWYPGYWGPEVGFYGGIDYGYGYTGVGYWGGYWNQGTFYYNRSVTNVNVTNIENVYSRPVADNVEATRTSFNGGPGGITGQATPAELAAAREAHRPPTAAQTQHERAARSNRSQWAAVNHGRPAVAATPKPAAFSGRGVVAATNRPTYYHAVARATTGAPSPAGNRMGARTQNAGANHGRPLTASRSNGSAPPRTMAHAGAHAAPAPRHDVARPTRTMAHAGAHAAPAPRHEVARPTRTMAHAGAHAAPAPRREVAPPPRHMAHAAPAPRPQVQRPIERAPRPMAHAAPPPRPQVQRPIQQAPRTMAHAAPAPRPQVQRPVARPPQVVAHSAPPPRPAPPPQRASAPRGPAPAAPRAAPPQAAPHAAASAEPQRRPGHEAGGPGR